MTWRELRNFGHRYSELWTELNIAAANAVSWAVDVGHASCWDGSQVLASAAIDHARKRWRRLRALHQLQLSVCEDVLTALNNGERDDAIVAP